MTARDFLEGIEVQDRRVKLMREELRVIRESLDVSGISYESTGAVSATKNTSKMADLIAGMIDYENDLKAEELKLAAMRLKATTNISKLSDATEREVLRRWYLLFQDEDAIKDAMSYSRSSIFEYRRKGMEHLEKSGLNWTVLD